MKDCNAASKIVKTQSGELPADVGTTDSAVLPNSKLRWRLLLESTDVVCQEDVEQCPKEGMDAPRSIVFSAKSLKNEDQHSRGSEYPDVGLLGSTVFQLYCAYKSSLS